MCEDFSQPDRRPKSYSIFLHHSPRTDKKVTGFDIQLQEYGTGHDTTQLKDIQREKDYCRDRFDQMAWDEEHNLHPGDVGC